MEVFYILKKGICSCRFISFLFVLAINPSFLVAMQSNTDSLRTYTIPYEIDTNVLDIKKFSFIVTRQNFIGKKTIDNYENPELVILAGNRFTDGLDISNVKFQSGLAFHKNLFHTLSLNKVEVYPASELYDEVHKGFLNDTIIERTSFWQVDFHDVATFRSNLFSGECSFVRCNFNENAMFYANYWRRELTFFSCFFNKSVNFELSTFKGKIDFQGSKFMQPPTFSGVQLPDTLSFVETDLSQMSQEIFLISARIDSIRKGQKGSEKKCVIFLYHTNVDKFVIDYNKFILGFDELVSNEEKKSIYQQVIKKCRDFGLEESAQGFDIDFQELKIRTAGGFIAPALIWFQHYWWEFGYQRGNILRNTAFAFLFCFVVILTAFRFITSAYFPDEQIGLPLKTVNNLIYDRPGMRRYFFRFKISFFYTSLLFFGWKMDHSKIKFVSHPWICCVVYFIYFLGIVHLAYLASYIVAR